MKTNLIILILLISCSSFAQTADTTLRIKRYGPDNKVFVVVEKMPAFPGGEETLKVFLKNNLKYPESAMSKLKAIVYISFLVEQSGKIIDVKILKGLNQNFDEEAIRLVKLMPEWIPGEQSGAIVKVRYTLPIKFEKPE